MAGQARKILCIGMACVDIISICDTYPIEDSDQRCVDQLWQRGGNASNTATVISLLPNNCSSTFMGTLARSGELRFIEDELCRSHVDFSACVYCDNHTCPVSVVIVNKQNGSRTIIHANKNLPELSNEDLSRINVESGVYSWIHIEGRPNEDAAAEFLQRVDRYNKTQPADKRIRTSVELEKPRTQLTCLLDKADIVFVSKEHARCQGFSTKQQTVTTLVHRIRDGATIICPWGEEGAVAMTNCPGSGDIIMTSSIYPPEKVVDTLGAGDTFVAGCISALCCGQDLQQAIMYGCKIAGAKCGIQGLYGLEQCEQC